MIFASGLGMVLSLVFGCLLLALIGELYYLLWWKSLPSKPPAVGAPPNPEFHTVLREAALDKSKEAIVEAELMRIQSRLLSTISEETKEDLESEAGKSSRKGSRTRSLGDLILAVEESPLGEFRGFNPLFESAMQGDDGLRYSSSPPPKMKFLRDAEEKQMRRLVHHGLEDGRDGSFVRILFRRDSNHS